MNLKPILLSGLVLGAFAIGGVAVVAVTYNLVNPRIASNQYEAMKAKLATILPMEKIENDPLQDRTIVHDRPMLGAETSEIYRARGTDGPVAVVLESVVPDGYAGPIRMLVSVLHDGTIGGVRVLSHHETPGLGDKIEEAKTDWVYDFNGKSLKNPPPEQWGVKRDGGAFDQFTGATITPRSIVAAVKRTLLYVDQQSEQLFSAPAEPAPSAKGSS